MPIIIQCSCGKKVGVGDEHAGKRFRCPACQAVHVAVAPGSTPEGDAPPSLELPPADQELALPATRAEKLVPMAEPVKMAVPVGLIRFHCACGKQMQTRTEYAGTTVQCPVCGDDVLVPVPRPRREEAEVVAPEAVDAVLPTPIRQFAPAPPVRLIPTALAALLFLALMGGVGWGWFRFRDAPPSHFAYVPPDANGLITVRPANIWKTRAAQEIWNKMEPAHQASFIDLQDRLGLRVEDVDRVTVVDYLFTNNGEAVTWFVVSTTKPYDPERFTAALNLQRRQYGETNYMAGSLGFSSLGFWFASDRTFVVSNEIGVKRCINAIKSKKRAQGKLTEAIDLARNAQHVYMSSSVPPALRDMFARIRDFGGGPPAMRVYWSAASELRHLELWMDWGESVRSTILARFGDEETAAEVVEGLDNAMKLLKQARHSARNGFSPAGDLLESLDVKTMREGRVVTISLRVEVPFIELALRRNPWVAAPVPQRPAW
jgi:hypothetical protein